MDDITFNAIHETIMGILGIGMSFVLLFIIYRAMRLRNQERLALIDRNMDPSLAGKYFQGNKVNDRKMGWIFISTALGISSGYIINLTIGIPDFVSYSTMILLFCGSALLYLHRLEKIN
tara:strand:- start:201 stop:557 length:357 start_codon:yes stop_codon:yes gene_type:complete